MHRVFAHILMLCVLVGACYRDVPLTIAPRQLARHGAEFRRAGKATVHVDEGRTVTLRTGDRFTVHLSPLGTSGSSREVVGQLSIGELVANCPRVLPHRDGAIRRSPPCLLLDVTDGRLVVGRASVYDRARTRLAIAGSALLALAAAGGACIAECDDPLRVIAVPTTIIAGVFGILLVFPPR
jgi:hypothetical protein